MINSTPSECSQHRHAAKQRAIKKEVQELIKKTSVDQQKRTLQDFDFSPIAAYPTPTPPPYPAIQLLSVTPM
jgi:hypothetical protein